MEDILGIKIVDFGRLTAWNNNQVTDVPSEIIYLEDLENKKVWSIGINPTPDNNDYYITYGFGYSKYMHTSSNIYQELTVFVPREESCKIQILHFENKLAKKKELKLVYYIKPVLDEDEIKSDGYLDLKYNESNNLITVKNELTENGNFDKVGGLEYLSLLPDKVPTTTNVDRYIKIVEEKALTRNLIQTANELISLRIWWNRRCW